jgi:hypothetical protein
MRSPARPATDEISMRRKPSFYCSRWSLVAGGDQSLVVCRVPNQFFFARF